MNDDLLSTLKSFAKQVNSNRRLRSLLNGWSPVVNVQSKDTNNSYHFSIVDSFIHAIEIGEKQSEHNVLLCADKEILSKLFSGKVNPARAHLDGKLDVYGSDKDEVKLDAISLVVWGI